MEVAQLANLDQTVKETHTARPRHASNRDVARSGNANKQAEENQYSSTLPKAFQGMLKTTTETGDIGLFSIRPSRLPKLNSPEREAVFYNENTRKPQKGFHSHGALGGDDRHRLPSYTRDASSEVISMYETASQKSVRKEYEDADCRSYSMTQNSLSSYSLAAHRSYASLRSQTDGVGLIQRPRSPFAYPARLKRPGFRPSSPALTDDGVIDYSRRIRIGRMQLGQTHNNSSPSSLYAQRRKPPPPIRNEANRSTTCLLNQPSTPSSPPSPSRRNRTEVQVNDWHRRTFPVSVKTSPARSVKSLASAVNVSGAITPVFSTMTPGKGPPPSPLYYDYTEDFHVDEHGRSEFRPLPPPAFKIEESFHECSPVNVAKMAAIIAEPKHQETCLESCENYKPFAASVSKDELPATDVIIDSSITPSSIRQSGASAQECQLPVCTEASKRDTNVIGLSGSGYGARQLSSHVEQAFGLPSSPYFEIGIQNSVKSGAGGLSRTGASDRVDNECATHLLGSPGHVMIDERQGSLIESDVPRLDDISKVIGVTERKKIVGSNHKLSEPSRNLLQFKSATLIPAYVERSGEQLHDVSFARGVKEDLSNTDSLGKTVKVITATDIWGHQVQCLGWPQNSTTSRLAALLKSSADLTTFPDSTSDQYTYHDRRPSSHTSSRINQEMIHKQGLNDDQNPILENKAPVKNLAGSDMLIFKRQKTRQLLLSRSESPMLAPKPISPARQLKLKGSVPQLMKALPLPPTDPHPESDVSQRQFSSSVETDIPTHSPHSVPEAYRQQAREQAIVDDWRLRREAGIAAALHNSDNSIDTIPNQEEIRNRGMTVPVVPVVDSTSVQFPKLKLKRRHSPNSQDISSAGSVDQGKGLPKSRLALEGQLSASNAVENPKILKPKFKLKVTRASNSTHETIRIHRESAERKSLTGLNSQNMKDLFTPHSARSSVLGRVGRHFQKRPTKSSQSHRPFSVGTATSISSSKFWHSSGSAVTTQNFTFRSSQRSLHQPFHSPEARSLSSDGFLITKKRNKLKSKLSNWDFRIEIPHVSRVAKGQCYDTQSDPAPPLNDANSSSLGSSPYAGLTDANGKFRQVRGIAISQQTQKMKSKIRKWLREARSTISDHVKLRVHVGKGDNETAQVKIGS